MTFLLLSLTFVFLPFHTLYGFLVPGYCVWRALRRPAPSRPMPILFSLCLRQAPSAGSAESVLFCWIPLGLLACLLGGLDDGRTETKEKNEKIRKELGT